MIFILGFQINEDQESYILNITLNIEISYTVAEDEKVYTCAVFDKKDKQWLNISQPIYLEVRGKLRGTELVTYLKGGVETCFC